MSSRWNNLPHSGSQASSSRPGSAPDSPVPHSSSKWSRISSENPNPFPWSEPLAMEDNCARYLLSVMVLFLRQSAQTDPPLIMAGIDSTDIDFRDYEALPSLYLPDFIESQIEESTPHHPDLPRDLHSPPSSDSVRSGKRSVASIASILASTGYERTPMSMINSARCLNDLVEKFTGRIVFHISASNWNVVFNRIRQKIRQLSQNEVDLDAIDIQLLAHCALDRNRLVQVLSG